MGHSADVESHPSKNEGWGTREGLTSHTGRGENSLIFLLKRYRERGGPSTPHELHFVRFALRSG